MWYLISILILLYLVHKYTLRISNTCVFDIRNVLPMSGSEPDYNVTRWNDDEIISTHNCYAYLLDDIMPKITNSPQPCMYAYTQKLLQGELPETSGFNRQDTCNSVFAKMQEDIPQLYTSTDNDRCASGYYKGFLSMDPGDDYHFYRQDSSGLFSHKPGKLRVFRIDSHGDVIYRPDLAHKNYGPQTNYTVNCGYFCIPVETDIKYNLLYGEKNIST